MKWTRDDQATQDLVTLVCDRLVMLSVIERWTDEQCRQAEEWAAAVHFRASDNAVKVPQMPAHVAECPRFAVDSTDLDHL